MEQSIKKIEEGFKTAFVDRGINSDPRFRSQFIYNDFENGKKVSMSLEKELKDCDEFMFSVAFITESGITLLLQTLKELEERGIRGRVLTTNYLYFNEPKALKRLNSFDNIEVKMYFVEEEVPFHTKGYMFRDGNLFSIITGSSNLTGGALSKNKEWNTKIVGTPDGEYVREILIEFDYLWDKAVELDDWIDEYAELYSQQKANEALVRRVTKSSKLVPNSMQTGFIRNLNEIVAKNNKRALLISATATGKTYASAFAMQDLGVKCLLFLVHREQIASQAMESYEKIFGSKRSYGLLSGTRKDMEEDFIFATVQTMSKDENLAAFDRNHFDAIVIDEVHRAGAAMHRKVMDYFTPSLYLGMTASPERTDDFDIYNLFDYNIAYEIRLEHALKENLLCPFHYFGISEFEHDGQVAGDDTSLKDFNKLVDSKRIDYIIDKIKFYGYSGDRVKGLVFCSTRKEAKALSEMFNDRGYRTVDLSGEDNQKARLEAIDRLVNDRRSDNLDYIFTVDIFNEGIDVPEINQVVMLRPTQSPIIFVQQLGRGLRKAEGKKFVVIIDFIGNYSNNYMIPLALSGDRSYNKDSMRRVASGTSVIPGCSSIHFDKIARKRIYGSIDTAKTNDARLIKEEYRNLKFRVGRIPKLMDFLDFGAIDAIKIFDKFGSYYSFLIKNEKDYGVELNEDEANLIELISKKHGRGKRVHELEMLDLILQDEKKSVRKDGKVLKKEFLESMDEKYSIKVSKLELESTINNLNLSFLKSTELKKHRVKILNEDGSCSEAFIKLLENQEFVEMMREIIDYGKRIYKERFSDRYLDTNFQLYQRYTYEDVCRLLNWKKDMNALNIGGYFYDSRTKTLPVFINYEKSEDAIAYEDRFISNTEIIALSKHPRKVDSADADHIYKRCKEDFDNRIFLFVRKNKDDKEAKEFYFLGEMEAIGNPEPVILEKSGTDAFEITYALESPVREDIYTYIKED